MTPRPCGIDDCDRKHYAKGWCYKHYMRARNHGDPHTVLRVVGDHLARLESYTVVGPTPEHRPNLGPCWLWTGVIDDDGYGQVRHDGQTIGAHRLSWLLRVGPIPQGHDLDHLCRVRHCIRPTHLEPVTRAENNRRMNAHRMT